jgi:ankyrin repeat protein
MQFLFYLLICIWYNQITLASNDNQTFECNICIQDLDNEHKISTTCKPVPHEACCSCICDYYYDYQKTKCWNRCIQELENPLFLAIKCKNVNAVKIIFQKFPPTNIDILIYTLKKAEILGTKQMCDFLINDNHSKNVFLEVVDQGHFHKTKFFLSKGMSVKHERNFSKETALHIAVGNKTFELVKLLVNHGADVNAENAYKQTPLHFAVQKKCMTIAKFLLKNTANVNKKNVFGETPFFHAMIIVSFATVEKVQCFVNYGAKLDDSDHWGNTILHNTARLGNLKIMKYLLLNHTGNVEIDAKDNMNCTPLMHAIWRKQNKAVKFLLQNAANANVKNFKGNTPLHTAANLSNIYAVKMLLKYGASPWAENRDLKTALDCTMSEDIINIISKYMNLKRKRKQHYNAQCAKSSKIFFANILV